MVATAIRAWKPLGRALGDSHLSALLLHLGNATWAKSGLPVKQSPSVFPGEFTQEVSLRTAWKRMDAITSPP